MFHWLFARSGGLTIRQDLFLSHKSTPIVPEIGSGLVDWQPVEYAKANNDYLYFTNGLDGVFKWQGTIESITTVGVPAPTEAPVIASSGSGGIVGAYQAYVRFVDGDGNYSNLSPVSNTLAVNGASTILYTNVQAATDPKIKRRQILRNTSGQFLTFFVDIDTTNIVDTEFSSTRSDSDLQAQEFQALFDSTLTNTLANRRGLPPNDRHTIAFYNNRLWLYGEVPYSEGSVLVTNGSTTVTGTGTQWRTAMEGRFVYFRGTDRSYEIDAVDEVNQTLTLTEAFAGNTNKFSEYTIRPASGTRNLIYYSEPGEYDAWPTFQALEVGSSDDLDEYGTGLCATQSFLFILQRRHIYRMSFLRDPLDDGGVFLSARRGCVNNRCWVSVDGFVYMLDDRGIYKFDGSDRTEDLSTGIQDLFFFDAPDPLFRVNWKASRYFHAAHDRDKTTIRWFVTLSGHYLPRHALCYNYARPAWWIEEYPFPVGDSLLLKLANAIPAVLANREIYAQNVGPLDCISERSGETYASVASATRKTVTLTGVSLPPAADLVGVPVVIVDGCGKRQQRLIASVSGLQLRVTRPWMVTPDTTSKIQIGGIKWEWRSGWYEWPHGEQNQPRRVTMKFRPKTDDSTLDIRIFNEYALDPQVWKLAWPHNTEENSGLKTEEDSPDAVLRLNQERGFGYLTLDGYRRYDEWTPGTVSVHLRGVSSEQSTRIYEVAVDGLQ